LVIRYLQVFSRWKLEDWAGSAQIADLNWV